MAHSSAMPKVLPRQPIRPSRAGRLPLRTSAFGLVAATYCMGVLARPSVTRVTFGPVRSPTKGAEEKTLNAARQVNQGGTLSDGGLIERIRRGAKPLFEA